MGCGERRTPATFRDATPCLDIEKVDANGDWVDDPAGETISVIIQMKIGLDVI